MKKILLLSFNVLVAVLTACQPVGPSTGSQMLKPGDEIDGMILATGAADAPPLGAFCSLPQHSGNTTTSHCDIPLLSKLAIGHVFMLADEALTDLDWSQWIWELSIDDRTLDLERFGTYDFVLPTMSHSPSSIREVFTQFTAWDVVLTNLKPGAFTLNGLARSETDTYTWIVDFIIEAPYGFDSGSMP